MEPTGSGDELRRCGRCGDLKPATDFAWRRRERGQRDNYCRACRADYRHAHYAANRDRYIDNAGRRRRALVRERVTFLVEFLRRHPCADCGEPDPLVLEFDHLGHKHFNISKGLRDRNWDSVLAEIAKCEVVCANCHRRRTATRNGFLRALLTSVPNRSGPMGVAG